MSNTPNDLIKFLRGLRTIKDFKPEPVSDAALQDILEVGRWTGSASNRQPTEIVVIRDPETRQKLTGFGANTAAKAAVTLLIVTPGDPARFELEVFDDGLLAERLELAAAAHGLGAGVNTLKGDGPQAAKQLLGIPAEKRVRTVINIGVPDTDAIKAKPKVPQPRKPMTDFVHWDRY